MKIQRRDVEHVAALARLQFQEHELDTFTRQLNDILDYFEKLQQVDTTNVAPSTHAVSLNNAFREDNRHGSLPSESALGNAPGAESSYFKVPRIIEV